MNHPVANVGPGRSHTVPESLELPLRFDAARLAQDLSALQGAVWTEHFVKQNYEGGWSVIPLRAPAGETHPIRMIYPDPMASVFVDTPVIAQTPYFRAVLAQFRCPLRGARLMRLSPGSRIKPHVDHDLDFESGCVRLHVPIATNPGVAFRLGDALVPMAPGSCWYLRLTQTHSVENHGTEDRVHLVIDADVDDWLRDLFRRAG